MLAAEGLQARDIQMQSADSSMVASTPGDGSTASDANSGCIAIVFGCPRWTDAVAAHESLTWGNARAALSLYLSRNTALLQVMKGSFVLVIIDSCARRVVIALDRTGIERLCFARAGATFVFSTSARAVARHPAIQAPVNRQAIFEYLYCHMVPSPDTAFAGVEKLLPAECIEVSDGRLNRRFYWQLAYAPDNAVDEAAKHREFLDLASQAVTRQLDRRPVGAFLSGGTDSSTISGLLGQVSGEPAKTFSIGFEAQGFDELEYARIASRHFGTLPHEYYVTPEDVAEAMPLIAQAYDEPFGNASAAPTYFCAKLAREFGMDILLAGDGGDEFFGGNERYAKQGVFEPYQRLPPALRRMIEPLVLGFPLGASLWPVRKAQSYIRQARIPLPDRLETYNFLNRHVLGDIFEEEFLSAIDTERSLNLMRDTYARCPSSEPLERMMFLDHKFTLADNDLRKVSRMCEMAGVEVRFPFLDDDLIEFSATLRPEQKVHRGRLRVLFKDALRGFLPDETIKKSKHGFGLPFGLWLTQHGALQDIVESTMKSLRGRGILREGYLDQLIQTHRSENASYYGVMIWVLTELELWLGRQSIVEVQTGSHSRALP